MVSVGMVQLEHLLLMTKSEATARVKKIWQDLHDHCSAKIREIEEICDEHGIVEYFTGLPPFDEYGNSGSYLPKKENGEGWLSSSEMKDGYGYSAEAGAWSSSSDRCS